MEKELHIMGEEKRAELRSEKHTVKLLMLQNAIMIREYRELENKAIWFALVAACSLIINILQFVF